MMTWMQTSMNLDNVFEVSPLNMTAGIFLEEDPREERRWTTQAPSPPSGAAAWRFNEETEMGSDAWAQSRNRAGPGPDPGIR